MVRSEEAQDSGAGVGSGVPPLLGPLDGWWKLNQLDNWLRLDPGRDSDFLLDDVVVVVVAAAAVVVDWAIRSKRMAKQRSNRKMGRNSDDLEPGRVKVADVVDIAVIPGSREEITLIFNFFSLLFFSQAPASNENLHNTHTKVDIELALNCRDLPCTTL